MKEIVPLDGTWELAGFEPGKGDWRQAPPPYPIGAVVPGEVHTALEAAGVIEDPFYGVNEAKCQWVEQRDWWYRSCITVPQGFCRRQYFLEFDGLDTYSTILLNGETIGTSTNMNIPYRFDVTGKLIEGQENLLEVRFRAVMSVIDPSQTQHLYARYSKDRLAWRKMQAQFGWDWMPRFLGAGIWKSARIAAYNRLSIEDAHVQAALDGRVTVDVEIKNHAPNAVDASLVVSVTRSGLLDKVDMRCRVPVDGTVVTTDLQVDHPELWWPNGMGDQPMYTVRVELLAESETVDSRDQSFAFRTIDIRDCDEQGNLVWRFVVNGKPVYAKGANWIPPDCFPSRIPRDTYQRLLMLAKNAHFNMMRVWGGAVYGRDQFYDLCDNLGILVWQDFMFSLGQYPDDDDHRNEVAVEPRAVVRRLRNHPCIALWCGNNECEMDTEASAVWPGKAFFHEIIPGVIRELDRSRPYWPSCPYGGPIAHSKEYGDYHGEPWFHGAKGDPRDWHEYLEKDIGLFMSEFPTQGVPEYESVLRFIPDDDRWPAEGPVWDIHDRNNVQREEKIGITSHQALAKMIKEMAGQPNDLEEYCYLGGMLQGQFLKWQIDYYRRTGLGGSLLWCFDDAWPAVAYSIVDYYLRPKPAYYYVKRAFAPVLLTLDINEAGAAAWVVNDLPHEVRGSAQISRVAFANKKLETEEIDFELAPRQIAEIWHGDAPEDRAGSCLIGALDVDGKIVSWDTLFFDMLKNLRLPQPGLQVSRNSSDGSTVFSISSCAFAEAVALLSLPVRAIPSDNYFTLAPGETRKIRVKGLKEQDAARAQVVSYRQGHLVHAEWV